MVRAGLDGASEVDGVSMMEEGGRPVGPSEDGDADVASGAEDVVELETAVKTGDASAQRLTSSLSATKH